MITKTSESAFRILLYLQLHAGDGVVSLHAMAKELGGSQTYLAKVANLLVRDGILVSVRGAQGGLKLGRKATDIPLLDVISACQGTPIGAYCEAPMVPGLQPCNYHAIMENLHQVVLEALGSKTIADLVQRPCGRGPDGSSLGSCRMNACLPH